MKEATAIFPQSNLVEAGSAVGYAKIKDRIVFADEDRFPVTIKQSKYGTGGIDADVMLGTGPNTVAPIPDAYEDADLKLTLDDGSIRGYLDRVAFSGRLFLRDDGLCRLD
jgi:hypothetical protein